MTEPSAITDDNNNEPAKKTTALTPAPPRSLTIPAKRLAGSPACLNCGTVLAGPFCHYCGQPDKNLLRFFPVLLREMLSDFLDFDSRFVRTMKPLLFHPGKLTRDYLDGRRFRYTPPLRLYIFASMAFFLIAAMLASSAISVGLGEDGKGAFFSIGKDDVSKDISEGLQQAIDSGDMTEAEAAELRKLAKKSGISILQESIEAEATPATDATGTAATADTADNPDAAENDIGLEASVDADTININGKPWNRETNPVTLPLVPDFINDWINNEIEESPQKGREIESNPNIIVDQMMDVLPIAVFIMLPLVALLLKFWYLFSGHYYIEHLLHALHNHAFLFVVFILMILSDAMVGWQDPDGTGLWADIDNWLDVLILIWIPLYLLISLKKVYQQGWILTFMKFSLVGISYVVLLSLVTGAAALASFVLL